MPEDAEGKSRNARHRIVLAAGGLLGAASFAYVALARDLIRGRPYGPKWWTSLVLGTVVFGCITALAALFVYVQVRRGRVSRNDL